MKKATFYFFALFFALLSHAGYSQNHIKVYVQNASSTANVQWTKMTHLVHSFFNPMDATGNITDATGLPTGTAASSIWFVTANFTTMIANARAANPKIKIIISTGGAPTSSDPNITTRLNTILSAAVTRTELVNDLGAFIQRYDLDGFDFDLEHPVSATEKNNHQTFLQEMKTKLNSLEATMCKDLEVSIALNGETDKFIVNPSGSDYVNAGVDPYVDYYHLMTYDASYAAHNAVNSSWPLNHSPLIHAQEAVRDFASPPFNWAKSKMVIGIPFYGRNGGGTSNYSAINAGQTAGVYNADASGGYNYNGCVTIGQKVSFSKTEGLAGVLVWEGSQDLNNSTGFSLASCLYTAMATIYPWEKTCCAKPNLGNDLITCNTAFPITLNSNTTAGSATYVWTRILPSALTINASGGPTQSISSGNGAGTYVVARTESGCTRTDTIVITSAASIPTPTLGADRNLCTVPYVLKPSNASSFPPGTTFQWQKGGVDITGEVTNTLYASVPATYTLVASLSGCTGSSDAITISASSISPVDACRTTAGTLTLGVTGGTGPYTWYSSDLPGNTIVGTGSTFTTPSLPLPSTTYYYVEDAGAITSFTVGETAAAPTGFANNVTVPAAFDGISMEFDVKNPVKVQSVSVFPWGGATYPFSFAVEIYNDNGTTVYTSPTTTYTVWPGATAQVIPLNAHLAIGKYRMRAIRVGGANDPAFFHHNTSAFPYGSAQDLTITRQRLVAQYGPFYSWVIGDYNACPRIRVRAEVAASCSAIFLPVDMIYFNAEKSENDVVLEWATGSEKDNDFFSVQRSLDGINFTTLGTVNGNGTSLSLESYGYVDKAAPKATLYYRLAQHDIDGDVTHSPIKIVRNDLDMEISVVPNPFANNAKLNVSGATGEIQLKIYDINGKLVQSLVRNTDDEITIGNNLASGFYIIEAVNNSSIGQYKFIKE